MDEELGAELAAPQPGDVPCACMKRYSPNDAQKVLDSLLEHTPADSPLIPVKVRRTLVSGTKKHGWTVTFYVKNQSLLGHPTATQVRDGELQFAENCRDGKEAYRLASRFSPRGAALVGFGDSKSLAYEEDEQVKPITTRQYQAVSQGDKEKVVRVKKNGPPNYLQWIPDGVPHMYPVALYMTQCSN